MREDDRIDRVRPDGEGARLRSRSTFRPWNIPQSTSTRVEGVSTRNREPVTVSAPPRNRRVTPGSPALCSTMAAG